MKRNELGRIIGSSYEFYEDESESWKDKKFNDVVFPKHEQDKPGEVIEYKLSQNELKKYLNKLYIKNNRV